MAAQIQILRRGDELWDLVRIDLVWKEADGVHVNEYDTIARVLRDGGFYYVEFPEWKADSYTWQRQPRGYLIPRAAFKVAAKGRQKTVMQ